MAVAVSGRAPRIANRGTMAVGRRFAVRGAQFRCAFRVEPGAELRIGDDVFVNQGTTIHAVRRITIGSHVRIGDVCAIYDTSFHEVDPGEGVEVAPSRSATTSGWRAASSSSPAPRSARVP